MQNLINKELQYAVVGATNNTNKFGYKVYKDLLTANFKVIPINPKGGKILNNQVYENLTKFQNKIDIVVFVIPPKIVLEELKTIKELEIKKVWMQPGSQSDEAIQFCEDNNIECIHDACIMIQKGRKGLNS